MALALPTSDDLEPLCQYVKTQLLAHGEQRSDTTTQPPSPSRPNGSSFLEQQNSDDADNVAAQLRELLTEVLQLVDVSTALFSTAGDGPVVSPSRFVTHKLPEIVDLHDRAAKLLVSLHAEAREHGFHFTPAEVRQRYLKFSDAVAMIENWTMNGLRMAEGRDTIVSSATVQDVTAIYNGFFENSQLFFVSECTVFDPRIQRRLLMPVYFQALRDHLRELHKETLRLRGIEDALKSTPSFTDVVFRPPLRDFTFMLESLQLYLAVSIIEDELTTVTYFRILYDSVQKEAKLAADRLATLPRPRQHEQQPLQPHGVAAAAPGIGAVTSQPPEFTEIELESIRTAFAAFDEVRHRVNELHDNIKHDIHAKNSSHRTRAATGRMPPIDSVPPRALPTTSSTSGVAPSTSGGGGWWGAIKAVTTRMLVGAADVVTCKAEIFPSGDTVDVDGVALTRTSPFASQKEQLLANVFLLVQAVDAIATGLEAQYPTLYHRDWKSKLQHKATNVMRKLESMSVVFSH